MIREQLVFIFFIFSFTGWLIELVFRTIYERQPVNPGFHKGPWLPLYGFVGVVIFFVSDRFAGNSLAVRMFFYFVLCTVFEFIAGVFLEKVFHRRYWDYSQNRLNIKGLVCPLYSSAWVLISIVVETFIMPPLRMGIEAMPAGMMSRADAVLLLIFSADFMYSSGIVSRDNINRLKGLFNG